MVIAAAIIVLLVCALLLSQRGRRGQPALKELRMWKYAHRGLHDETKPENSMAAFRAALEGGFGIELDVHLLKDGTLAILHDSDLKRVTGQEGRIEDLTADDLGQYRLNGTEQTIPTFRQVLELFDGKAPMIVEVKSAGGNFAALTKATCEMLDRFPGTYCVESFDPRCVRWLKQNRPDVVRGQLAEHFKPSPGGVGRLLLFAMTHNLLNFLTLPDFVAYKYADRNRTFCNRIWQKLWGVAGVSWTLCSREEYETAVSEGWIPIFENFIP